MDEQLKTARESLDRAIGLCESDPSGAPAPILREIAVALSQIVEALAGRGADPQAAAAPKEADQKPYPAPISVPSGKKDLGL